jgi:hypothetical protein
VSHRMPHEWPCRNALFLHVQNLSFCDRTHALWLWFTVTEISMCLITSLIDVEGWRRTVWLSSSSGSPKWVAVLVVVRARTDKGDETSEQHDVSCQWRRLPFQICTSKHDADSNQPTFASLLDDISSFAGENQDFWMLPDISDSGL